MVPKATSIALMTVRDWMYTDNNETFMDKVIFTAIRRTDIALYCVDFAASGTI